MKMVDRSILYKIKPFQQGDQIADASDITLTGTYNGALNGAAVVEDGMERLDATGIGAETFQFTGNFSAQSSNINDWFGGKQLVRLRCTGRGSVSSGVTLLFDLPGTTALNTAFDQLAAAGVAEELFFIIEYTGGVTNQLSIRPRSSPSPQIFGTTNIIVRDGVAARLEISRTGGVISDFLWTSITLATNTTGGTLDSIKLINPTVAIWNAADTSNLPSANVAKGNAYRVANVPGGSGTVLDEVMQNGDWVVWEGETFTSWTATPHQWFVLAAHDVRRISALETEFLNDVQVTTESDRNTIMRGANYADSAGEIRLKIYSTRGDYSAADLNTTGDIDVYTDPADQSGFLGIRLTGNQAALASTLPTLYVFSEDGSGNFTRLLNLEEDFSFEGDFGAESDYLSTEPISYGANNSLRIYIGTVVDRFNAPNLDINESNLSDSVQAKLNREDPASGIDRQRLQTVENKLAVLYPLTPDVHKLVEFSDIFDPDRTITGVTVTSGYTLMADFRDASTRYEQAGVTYDDTGTNVVDYTGLTNDLHRCFGFKVTAPSNKTLLTIFDGAEEIPYVDMNLAGNFRVNNYSHSRQDGEVVRNEVHFHSRTSGADLLNPGESNLSTFTLQNFPAGATETSRVLGFDIDIIATDGTEIGGHLVQINLPAANEAVARRTTRSSLSAIGVFAHYGTVNFEVSYELRVSGADLLVDFKLVSITSGFNVRINDVNTLLNYTAAATTTRTDNFVVLQDELGDYTFSGEAELLIAFHPLPDGNSMDVVPVVRESDGTVVQLNDSITVTPEGGFASVRIPDDIDFRTFLPDHFLIHRDLAHLATRANVQWVYGLALLGQVSDRQITETIDFPQGIILVSPNSTRYVLTVADDGTLKTDPA